MKRRFIAFAMLVVMTISGLAMSASAIEVNYRGRNLRGWSNSVTCELKNKRKDAYVTVTMSETGASYDIRMLSANGRVIWSENKSLKSLCKSFTVYRVYRLGKDNSLYELQFRNSNGGVQGKITVEPATRKQVKAQFGYSANANCKVYSN